MFDDTGASMSFHDDNDPDPVGCGCAVLGSIIGLLVIGLLIFWLVNA